VFRSVVHVGVNSAFVVPISRTTSRITNRRQQIESVEIERDCI